MTTLKNRLGLLFFSALIMAGAAQAKPPAFDPRSWKNAHAGPPTQILVLGSDHLSGLEAPISAAMMTPLLDKLAAFAPTIITHEGLSGEQCDMLKRYPSKYPGVFDSYCWGTEEAERATGLTVPAALAEIDRQLANWPSQPSAGQRRHLAALFLAANDRPSAQVQWLQLPQTERHGGDGVDDALVKILTRAGAKPNETYLVAVALAARLGLQRVYAVDDHTADSVQAQAGPDFQPAIEKLWAAANTPITNELRRREKALTNGADMLDLYRFINRPAVQMAFVSVDYGAALKQDTPALFGRQYVGWWETRNLRMVANIRAAFANHPGARVLNIVGASHKPYYDAYLDMMHEVKLVDAQAVLK